MLAQLISDNRNLIKISILWLIVILIVNPIGDFPLNDDWSYAIPVKSLLEGNGIKFTGWMSMTLFSQVLWGTLWCKIFGFSFTVLRFSTLFLGWIGIIYSYKLINTFLEDAKKTFVLTLLVVFNPIYMNLSFTYMTDIPFFTFSVISIYHTILYLKNNSIRDWIIGLLMSIIAILTRQLALVIPMSLLLIGTYNWFKTKKLKPLYFLPFLISLVAYVLYQFVAHAYFNAHGRYDEMNDILLNQVLTSPISWILGIINKSVIGFLYISLFLSPFLIQSLKNSKIWMIITSIIGGVVLLAFLQSKGYTFPILDNIIYNLGLGPATLYDYWFGDVQYPVQINQIVWLSITFIASVLLVFVITHVFNSFNKLIQFKERKLFLGLVLIGYIILICSIYAYDRYYILPTLIVLVLLIGFNDINANSLVFWMVLPIFIWYSILGTKDYLSWNRARWEVINQLLHENKIASNKIDGGFEFNGWYNYNDEDQPSGLKNVWSHNTEYIIGFEQMKGTEIIESVKYYSWLHMEERSIKALKKNDAFEEMKNPYF